MAEKSRMPYLAIVVLVAVVAVVVLVLNARPSSEEAVAGEALRQIRPVDSCSGAWTSHCSTLVVGESGIFSIKGTSYKIRLDEVLFQDYAGGVHSADFVINGKDVTLVEGETTNVQPDGRWMRLDEVLRQDYAGGVQSASFCLEG